MPRLSVQTEIGRSSIIHTFLSFCCYNLVQSATIWYNLVQTGTNWYNLVQPGTSWEFSRSPWQLHIAVVGGKTQVQGFLVALAIHVQCTPCTRHKASGTRYQQVLTPAKCFVVAPSNTKPVYCCYHGWAHQYQPDTHARSKNTNFNKITTNVPMLFT